jgi:glycosyltransferase involved in cell wall biosynthesis
MNTYPAVSVVVAVYNVREYLPRFVDSLRRQTFSDFEALFIDDASGDDSAALVAGFASADSRFRLLRHTENRGLGVVCNLGIREALGETICFADPDDLLPENSLEVRYAAYKKHNAIVRACHDEVTDEGKLLNHETRPDGLPEICRPGEVAARVGVNPFLCAHWAWLLPTGLLRRNNILHGENMRTADDIIMLTQLFFHISRLAWIPDTVYRWIKRAGSLSHTLYTPEHYANYFQCCDNFYEEAEKNGQPQLADMFFNDYCLSYPNHFLGQVSEARSNENNARKLIAEMSRVCERHNVFARCLPELLKNPIKQAGLYRLWHIMQDSSPSALQRIFNSQNAVYQLSREAEYETIRKDGWKKEINFDKFDGEQSLLRARYLFCDTPPSELYFFGNATLGPAFAKNRKVFDGKDYAVYERILWLPVPPVSPDNGEKLNLLVDGKNTGLDHTPADIRRAFAPTPLNDSAFPADVRALRRLARSEAVRERFKDAWMFIDKDTEADDNAEHMCRWVLRNHPEINAWFVLNEDSRDWPRLEREGFKLVAHGSDTHKLLYLNCAKLISSQMDRYIFTVVEEKFFADFPKPKFVCLPHGVTKDDVSGWFNSIPFDLFITATHDETASIVIDGTAYQMTGKEVRPGGFPRYDRWLEPAETENMVFAMPTWRADLVGAWDGKGQKRAINPDFYSSPFVKMWKEFFDDTHLKNILDKHGYRIVFFAHPCFEDYLDGLQFPAFVEKRSKMHGSMIDVMKKAKVMITDFSSVAYDMAYMRKPVIYYQYENKSDFTLSQRWTNGYINYETMGFGPVCRDKDALVAALDETLQTGCVMREMYAERAAAAFAFHDAKNCERAYDFIMETSRPFFNATDRYGMEK